MKMWMVMRWHEVVFWSQPKLWILFLPISGPIKLELINWTMDSKRGSWKTAKALLRLGRRPTSMSTSPKRQNHCFWSNIKNPSSGIQTWKDQVSESAGHAAVLEDQTGFWRINQFYQSSKLHWRSDSGGGMQDYLGGEGHRNKEGVREGPQGRHVQSLPTRFYHTLCDCHNESEDQNPVEDFNEAKWDQSWELLHHLWTQANLEGQACKTWLEVVPLCRGHWEVLLPPEEGRPVGRLLQVVHH